MEKILLFYGRECPHCKVMLPLASKLAKDEKIKFEKMEVWHNEKNAKKMREYKDIIIPKCEGTLCVPAFISEDLKKAICGEDTYDRLRKWTKKVCIEKNSNQVSKTTKPSV